MKKARELKKLIQTLSKRSDFNIQFVELHPKVDSKTLKAYKGVIPDDLLSFYQVMNGCSFSAQHTFEQNLYIGINIPKIEYLRAFDKPSEEYNFNDDEIKVLPFEWIESTSCTFFYHLPKSEKEINNATIIQAESGYEDEFNVVCHSLEEWIDKAMNAGLSLGWAHSGEHFQQNVQTVNAILSTTPEKRKIYLPNTRVKTIDDALCRGTVLKQIKTKEKHSYYGDDFILVKYDVGKTYWSPTKKVKTINKKDLYESLYNTPNTISSLLTLDAETSAITLARIGMYNYENYSLGDDEHDLSYPIDSLRHVGLFGQLPLEESARIIFELCNVWIKEGKGQLKVRKKMIADGSEFDKKDQHIKYERFSYFEMINAMIGCLVVLIIKERIEDNRLSFGNISQQLREIYQLLETAPDLTKVDLNNLSPNIESHEKIFTSTNLSLSIIFNRGSSEDWHKEFGLNEYSVVL